MNAKIVGFCDKVWIATRCGEGKKVAQRKQVACAESRNIKVVRTEVKFGTFADLLKK